jgi:hypothetical protein
MAWVTWRQHRLTLAALAGLLGAASLYLLITGLRMHRAYALVIDCHPATSSLCLRIGNDFSSSYTQGTDVTSALLLTIPALIGAFVGSPLLARELETGTFRYTWTQGFGRTRWALAKLGLLAFAVTVAAGAFSAVFSWWSQPLFGPSGHSPLYPTMFYLRGVAFAGWALAAFAIGAFAGTVIRRVVPAMFATLAVWAGLALATGAFLRQRYEAPLVTTATNVAHSAWLISQWWTRAGKPVSLTTLNQALHPDGVTAITPTQFQAFGVGAGIDPVQYLTHHGFTQWTTYQPASRFWPFQSIEGGWLLALSLVLLTATVWLVRRRAA